MPSKRMWDTATCLAWLMNEEGIAAQCQSTLDAVDRGEVELYVSALAIVETLHLKGANPVPKEKREQVRSFFRRRGLIVVEISRHVAELAQDVYWDHGIKPKDAIHVACALEAACDILETKDEGLIQKTGLVLGERPALLIQRPGIDLTIGMVLPAGAPIAALTDGNSSASTTAGPAAAEVVTADQDAQAGEGSNTPAPTDVAPTPVRLEETDTKRPPPPAR